MRSLDGPAVTIEALRRRRVPVADCSLYLIAKGVHANGTDRLWTLKLFGMRGPRRDDGGGRRHD